MPLRIVFDTMLWLSLFFIFSFFQAFSSFLHRWSCGFSRSGHLLADPDRALSLGSSRRPEHLALLLSWNRDLFWIILERPVFGFIG